MLLESPIRCASCEERTSAAPCAHCGRDPLLGSRYRLLEPLGRGSAGVTWRAVDGRGQQVAIKVMPLQQAMDAKRRQLLEREVRVLEQLDHPGIPRYVEHFEQPAGATAQLCLVQELIPGQSLEQGLQRHRHDAGEVLAIIEELAGILQYLHERTPPVIHRDIKPGNVMRRLDGRLVLVDFGSVLDVVKGQLGGSTVAGTFGYMAPEQFAGDAEPATDLYGLGALAVALLTRREPRQLQDHANRLRWAEHTRVPQGVHDLVNRLVEPDIARRAPDAAWVRERVRAVAGGRSHPPPAAIAPRTDELLSKRPRGLHWWLLAGGGGLGLALLLLVTLAKGLVRLDQQAPAPPDLPDPEPPVFLGLHLDASFTEDGVAPDETRDRAAAESVVRAIGDSAAIRSCMKAHSELLATARLQLQVLVVPPGALGALHVQPTSLQGSALEACLLQAAADLRLDGVAVEREGTVALEFP